MNPEFLSLVVVHYNIPRELPRTLYSLSPLFQRGISPDEYEVIVVDNGSRELPDLDEARSWGLDIHLIQADRPSKSPAHAINMGLNASSGTHVGVFIDGARMASNGLLAATREALRTADRAIVGTRGRYLGPKAQRLSMLEGYDQAAEDEMLESISWKLYPERLFANSVFDESSGPSWLHSSVSESNSLFMSRVLWRELGGYSEEFEQAGGGFVNLDTLYRACSLPDVHPILLLGEATFHQFHGGAATNVPRDEVTPMRLEYARLRGGNFYRPKVDWTFYGRFGVTATAEELGITLTMKRRIIADAARDAGKAAATATPAKKPTTGRTWRKRRRKMVNSAKRALLRVPGVCPVHQRVRRLRGGGSTR